MQCRSPSSRCPAGRAGRVYDEERDRVYANIREPAADRRHRRRACARSTRRFPVPSAGPHGLWLDRGRLFCAADGGALVSARSRQRRAAREPAAARRSRRRHARPRAAPPLRRDRRARRRLQLRQRPSRAARDGRDRARRAHDRLGPGRLAACTSSAPRRCGARRSSRNAAEPRTRAGSSPPRRVRALAYGLGSVLIGVTLADRGYSDARRRRHPRRAPRRQRARLDPARALRRPLRPAPLLPPPPRRRWRSRAPSSR